MKHIFVKIVLIFLLSVIFCYNYNLLSINEDGIKYIKNYGDMTIKKAIHSALHVENCYYFKLFDIYILTITLDDGIMIKKVEKSTIDLLKTTSIIYPRIYPNEIDILPLWIYFIVLLSIISYRKKINDVQNHNVYRRREWKVE